MMCSTSVIFSLAQAQESYNIPSWVKSNAQWWAQGQVGDSDFIKGMQYLIQNGIMKTPQAQASSSLSNHIPIWIKNNAGWWASGVISDDDFVKGMQFLVAKNIIHLETDIIQTQQSQNVTVPPSSRYPLHQNITTTKFWIGEEPNSSNRYISNVPSAWDDKWEIHYGGIDDPNNRIGYLPAAFTPKENPFYFGLAYNDFGNGHRKPEAFDIVYWSHEKTWERSESMLKNHWIKITKGDKTAYAQWEDAGKGGDDSAYVFGSARPANPNNNHSGLDVSPAVNDYLGLHGMGATSWQFVNFADVPDGPWKQIVTTSQTYWGQ